MTELALLPAGEVISVGMIAARQNVPDNFLEQILLVLKGAGYVASRRGKSGGYCLRQEPAAIKVAEVVQLTEGSLALAPCVAGEPGCTCPDVARCAIREVWVDLVDVIRERLEGVTVADLARRTRELEAEPAAPVYVI